MRQLRDQNISFLLNLGYKVVVNDEALWACILRLRYELNRIITDSIMRDKSSFFCKSLSKVWTITRVPYLVFQQWE